MSTTTLLPRHRRIELLAASEADQLVELAERCLIETSAPKLVAGPDVGLLMYQVREPVENERFYLGEILVSRAEVVHRGCRGWAMRLGDDREAALAAAVLDAEAEQNATFADAVLTGPQDRSKTTRRRVIVLNFSA